MLSSRNKLNAEARIILNNKSLVEESVKLYQGHQKNPDLMG